MVYAPRAYRRDAQGMTLPYPEREKVRTCRVPRRIIEMDRNRDAGLNPRAYVGLLIVIRLNSPSRRAGFWQLDDVTQ